MRVECPKYINDSHKNKKQTTLKNLKHYGKLEGGDRGTLHCMSNSSVTLKLFQNLKRKKRKYDGN